MKNQAELIIADSESDANLFYATKFLVPDPVLFIRTRGKKYLILNELVELWYYFNHCFVKYFQSILSDFLWIRLFVKF